MPGKSPFRIELSEDERRALTTVAARYSSSYRDVVRAKVVLYAAQGLSNEEIAARVDLPRQIVSKWRKRFFEQRLEGLKEAPRQGRPRVFPPLVVMQSRRWLASCRGLLSSRCLGCSCPTSKRR